MKNFVILSYGSETEYRRAIFTILSLFSWTEDYSDKYRVLLYTDRPDFFFSYLAPVSVNYVTLSSEKLKEMMGETGFIHRRKVAVIDSTFENYPGEDLIFVDSDTFFISCPSILMHAFKREESYMNAFKVFSSLLKSLMTRPFSKRMILSHTSVKCGTW